MDQLVIHGRTRYPSDFARHGDPNAVNKQIARTLLSLDGQLHSRQVSTQSSAPSNASAQRNTTIFVEKYNELAQRLSLDVLNVLPDYCCDRHGAPSETPPQASTTKRGIWRRLVRSSSSHQLTDTHALVRKKSINSFLGKQPKLALKCQSLDTLYQYGGTSTLNIPAPYRAFSLTIPTCIAASGNYLLQHGQNSGGIFRIPGQNSIVQALYHFYVAQMQEAQDSHGHVHASVGSICLPADIRCSVQDVASVFKKFLWDLPGGILGSVDLFRALHNVQSRQGCERFQPRLCALAILSLLSTRRIAIISAVLGLLACLKQDVEGIDGSPNTPSRALTSESMSSKAVSLVFAPILLGNLTDQITIQDSRPAVDLAGHRSRSETPRRGFKGAFRATKYHKTISTDPMPEIQASVERNNAAAATLEMMLRSWEAIAFYMRTYDTQTGFERSSKSSSNLIAQLPPLLQRNGSGGQTSRETSNGSTHGQLQVPQLAHSVSMRTISHQSPSNVSEDDDIVIDQTTQDTKQAAYPKLVPGITNTESRPMSNIVLDNENQLLWKKKLSHGYHPSEKSLVASSDAFRDSSGSTMLFTASTDQGSLRLGSNRDSRTSLLGSAKGKSLSHNRVATNIDELNAVSTTRQEPSETTIAASEEHLRAPRNESDKPLKGLVDPAIDVCCPTSETSGSEMGSRNSSVPGLRLLPDWPLAPQVPLSRQDSILKSVSRNKHGSSTTLRKDQPSTLTPQMAEQPHSVRVVAQKMEDTTNAEPLSISPSLIPRPVLNARRYTSSKTGSPRSRNPDLISAASTSRIPRTTTLRARSSFTGTSERLQPMYPRPFLGTQDLQGAVTRSDPVPRSMDHSSSRTSGLRGEPVARQLDFDQFVGRSKSYRMADSSASWQRQQSLRHRGPTNVGTLYAEIRTLNDKLAGARRECAEWRNRAQWAEALLFSQSGRKQ